MKWVCFCVLFIVWRGDLFCQANTATPSASAQGLASALLGGGVSVTSASLNCGTNGAGYFSQTTSGIGISNGILLTTGKLSSNIFAFNHFNSYQTLNDFADSSLVAIDSDAVNDVCILEINFVPTCDSLKITYVFASEEYPSFVGVVNDAFGIFLTGPNPAGGNYQSQNIALLPNGTPVSINTVNSHVDSTWFVPNWPTAHTHYNLGFQGFTLPITSVAKVTPCSSYRLKIGIADALDHYYDSGVFLQSHSFSCSNGPVISTSASAGDCKIDGSASVIVTNASGSVTYQWLPLNQTTSSINGPPASYTCNVSYNTQCGPITQPIIVNIPKDTAKVRVAISKPILCLGDTSILKGPDSAVVYLWVPSGGLNNSAVQSPHASPVVTTNYSVISTYANGCKDTGVAHLQVFPVHAGINAAPLMGYDPLSVIFTNTSSGASSYSWDYGNGSVLNVKGDSVKQVYGAGIYTVVLVASNAHCSDTATAVIQVEIPISIHVPNIFTPNGDDINDEFSIKTTGVSDITISVFDRWGVLLFESDSLTGKWDGLYKGAPVVAGTYFYVVNAKPIRGENLQYKGFLTLTR